MPSYVYDPNAPIDLKQQAFQPEACPKLVISVQDTGVGISKKDQRKLFKMFGCLSSTRQMNTQGVGLGLYICKTISEEFGGKIFVQSQLKRGTRFTFSFLLNEKYEEAENKEADLVRSQVSPSYEQRLSLIEKVNPTFSPKVRLEASIEKVDINQKILIADDEVFNLQALKGVLKIFQVPAS